MSKLLGGLSAATFLERHWQKEPLLVRQAMPGFAGFVSRDELFALATRDDALSRLVIEHRAPAAGDASTWDAAEGPFENLAPAALPPTHWTLLVQGMESLVPGGWELLRAFSGEETAFLPRARVDDVMVSYAAPGGSVGPHVDAYDVFLLQGPGRRRWQLQRGGDRTTDPDAPIKILTRFEAEEEHVLEAGDMLYLPPGVAHWGVAEDACFTYSIGFLAPSEEQLVQNFLAFLGQQLAPALDATKLYADPHLRPAADPFVVDDDMVAAVTRTLASVRWSTADVGAFLARLLTGPKPHVVFPEPARPLSLAAFAKRVQGTDVALALPTRMLAHAGRWYMNGEPIGIECTWLEPLARERRARVSASSAETMARLHALYEAGWITLTRG